MPVLKEKSMAKGRSPKKEIKKKSKKAKEQSLAF